MLPSKMKTFLPVFLALLAQTAIGCPSSKYVCEHDTLELSCKGNGLLDIHDAIYGRELPPEERCPHPVMNVTGGCKAESSLEVVRAQCQGKKECSVLAANSVFTDPCYDTYKYLEVRYSCSLTSHFVCEHDTLELSCHEGHQLVIHDAIYGRDMTGEERCPHTHIKVTSGCKAESSLEIVQAQCQGRENCSVLASNSVFTDPCVNTYKYLEVHSGCIAPKLHEFACENFDLHLECPDGHVLHIINASYGRHVPGEERCPRPAIQTHDCHANSSKYEVYEACQGKQSCTVPATNTVFGDPCPDTYKYLEVDYQCGSPSNCHKTK